MADIENKLYERLIVDPAFNQVLTLTVKASPEYRVNKSVIRSTISDCRTLAKKGTGVRKILSDLNIGEKELYRMTFAPIINHYENMRIDMSTTPLNLKQRWAHELQPYLDKQELSPHTISARVANHPKFLSRLMNGELAQLNISTTKAILQYLNVPREVQLDWLLRGKVYHSKYFICPHDVSKELLGCVI